MKQQIIELLEEVLERLDPNDIHNPALISKVKQTVEELKFQQHVFLGGSGMRRCYNGMYNEESIQEVVEALNDREITKEEVEEVRHISKLQEQAEELPYAVRNLNLPDLDDEELDRLAREEVERSLYEAGIIEDPDCDGGLNG